MTTRDDNPKVFISYSWSGPAHQEFVLNLAEKLMADGVHVLLDQWDLKEGHDKYVFMEQMVNDSEVQKVLIISDKKYAEKADARIGGVGTESQIISDEIYKQVNQEKFIPIVIEYSGEDPCLPTFLRARIYIDLSNDELFYGEYDKLLRNIYQRPEVNKPKLGKAPSHLFDESPVSLQTISVFSNLKDSIENEKPSTRRLVKAFYSDLYDALEEMRITSNKNLDDSVVDSIKAYKPYRDQFVELIQILCDYDLIECYQDETFSFFESLLCLHDAPDSMNSFSIEWFDNFKYISMELFLYFITCLIQSKKLDMIDFFLSEIYYTKSIRRTKTENFNTFNHYISVLDRYRKARLNSNRISITADMLHDSADLKGISFEDIMQTDFILCLRSIINFEDGSSRWFPRTLVYKDRWDGENFELFARAQSEKNFKIICRLLSVSSKKDLLTKFQKAKKIHNLDHWRFDYEVIPFEFYMNIENLYED